jgi:hypothetical protein
VISPVSRGVGRLGSIETPFLGWNTRDPLASMKPGFAPVFDNFIVEGGQPRVRRGWRTWATGLPGRVDGLLNFAGAGAAEQLFAASGAGIYDITAGGPVGAAVVSGAASARWSAINFAASGGNFLLAFNGADTPQTFNGTAWAAWTATGVVGDVSWAGQVAGRMFVGVPDYLGFYYGGAGAIAGTFTAFPLQGIARRGGSVCAMTTLSGDGGDGPQDLTVFLTTQGEAIVYAGTDPSSANTWALVGRWVLPRPLGAPHRCVASYGGDALYLCDAGILPLSAFRSGADAATVIDRGAMTRAIGQTWRDLANARRTDSGWGLAPLTRFSLVIANAPWGARDAQQIVVSDGGAVSRWGGIPGAVWAEGLGGRVFVGGANASAGTVMLWGEDTTDDGDGIRSEAVTAFSGMRVPGRTKRALRVQTALRDADGVHLAVTVLRDWRVEQSDLDTLGAGAAAPALPAPLSGDGLLVWDAVDWDEGLWGGAEGNVVLPWRSASAIGQAFAVRVSMVTGYGRPAWLATTLVHDVGGPVG